MSSVPLCPQDSGQCPALGRCTGKVDDDAKTPLRSGIADKVGGAGEGQENLTDVISESHEGPLRNQEEY